MNLRNGFSSFERQTGQSLMFWFLVAFFNFVAQVVFHRELGLGEFGTLNTALGLIALMTAPLLALHQGIAQYLAREHPPERRNFLASLRAETFVIVETATWAWSAIAIVVLFFLLPHLGLPRWSISVFIFFNVLVALGGTITGALYPGRDQLRTWGWLLAATALVRLLLGGYLGWKEPSAEAVLVAVLISGFIAIKPLIMRELVEWPERLASCRVALDRDFLLHVGATISVVTALFLFSSADRVVAQSWFGDSTNGDPIADPVTGMAVLHPVDWAAFDGYQTAGLLGRALIWGAQPLLLLFYAQRSRLNHTTRASLTFFWIYVGALLAGAIFLTMLGGPASALFCGDNNETTASMVPAFAVIMVPIGLLQALGVFALASRRYPECFALGACGLGYFLLLFLTGRQPGLMLTYMFGGASASILILLFIGIVRWGRKQP